MDGLIDHPTGDASIVCVWGRHLALRDHGASFESKAASPGGVRTGTLRFDQFPALPASVYGILFPSNDNRPHDPEPGPAYELDCLRQVFAPALLKAAEDRSNDLALGADRVLIAWGVIDEDAYLRRLAYHIGTAIEPLTDIARADCPLLDRDLTHAAEHGILPLRQDRELIWTVAPRGFAARRLCRLALAYPWAIDRMRLTSVKQLNQFLLQQAGEVLGKAAADGLGSKTPAMSAAPTAMNKPVWRRIQRGAQTWGLAALMTLPVTFASDVWSSMLAIWFLAFVGLRLAGSLAPRPEARKLRRLPDDRLPVYTVIAALYREATSVAPLMQAINALDYPREKLTVILVIEPDDLETRAAIARLGPIPHVQVLIAPATGPRTKPKALNCALPFARGNFTAVFDAEDRPDPGQLRAALDAFRIGGPEIACAQASLCIENLGDSWLSRMFSAEYAGQFDVFLPGLATFGMPLPLGGSSNHFRGIR